MKNTTKNASPDLIATLISTDNPPELKPPVENPPAPAPVPDPPATPELNTPPATTPAPATADGAKTVSDAELLSDPPPAPPASAAPVIDPPPVQETAEQKRGRGRPPGSKTKKADFSDLTPQVDFTALAGNLVDMTTGTAATMIGPEWHPRSPEERQMLVANLANYLKAKDVKDIPPGWMLVFVVGAYSMPRFSQPATKEKLKFGWQWAKIKVFPFFRRFFGKRKQADIRVLPKTDGTELANP